MGFYDDMKKVADELLGPKSEFSRPVTVTRPTRVERVNGVETTIPASTFTINGVLTQYSVMERQDSRILAGDQRFTCTAANRLMIGDMLSIDGVSYRVVDPGPVQPAGIRLAYKLQVRA